MGANPMGEIGVDAIVKAVRKHPSLKLLGLEGCMVSIVGILYVQSEFCMIEN